jgi:hypothetical protein
MGLIERLMREFQDRKARWQPIRAAILALSAEERLQFLAEMITEIEDKTPKGRQLNSHDHLLAGPGEYTFGASRFRLSRKVAKRVDRIANAHGFCLIEVSNFPGGVEYQRWFSGPSRGSPIDEETEVAILSDIEKDGIPLW